MLKKGDLILVVVLIVAVLAGLGGISLYRKQSSGEHKIAVIKQSNKIIRKIDLDTVNKPERITISGNYEDVILVEKGRIRFKEANCPDLVCVKAGWLSEKGQTAVCLPNRTMIKIEGEGQKVDGVTY